MNLKNRYNHFRPLQNTRLYEKVIDQIMELIRNGHLKLGDQLPTERKLADYLGISRSVLREAFRVLESRGILHTRQGGGRYLRQVHSNELHENIIQDLQKASLMDILEARLSFETQTAALAALRASPEEIEEMQSLCDLMKNDIEQFKAINGGIQFHYAIARASHNFVLQTMANLQFKLIQDLQQFYVLGNEAWVNLNCEHSDILEAIKNKDYEAASQLMRTHLLNVQNHM